MSCSRQVAVVVRRLVALAALCGLSSCVALGWRFGPAFSCADTAMFAAPPVIEQRGDDAFLTWTQGSFPFFFAPNYQPMDGRLVFALQGTSSSGSLAGRARELKIEGAENLAALKTGGAVWWNREPEPNGTFVPLTVVRSTSPAPP